MVALFFRNLGPDGLVCLREQELIARVLLSETSHNFAMCCVADCYVQ